MSSHRHQEEREGVSLADMVVELYVLRRTTPRALAERGESRDGDFEARKLWNRISHNELQKACSPSPPIPSHPQGHFQQVDSHPAQSLLSLSLPLSKGGIGDAYSNLFSFSPSSGNGRVTLNRRAKGDP